MKDENKFPEQEAPEKNTDNAFIKVGKDGEPVVPSDKGKDTTIEKDENTTTLDKR